MTIINLEAFLKLADYKLTYIISGAFTGSEYWINGDPDQFDAVKKSLSENWQDPYGPCVEDIYAEMLQRGMTLTKKGEEYWERMCNKGEGQSRECHRHLDETKGLSSPIDYYLY